MAAKGDGFQSHVGPMRSDSRGWVKLCDDNPESPPHIWFKSMQRAPARFDMAKLSWLNGEHLRALSPAVVREHVQLLNLSDVAINLILLHCEILLEIGIQVSYFLERPTPSVELVSKYINEENHATLKSLFTKLENLPEWNAVIIKNAMKEAISEHKLKFAQIGMPFRILLTGNEKSPDIAEVAAVLGQEETMERVEINYPIRD